jgi:hypothetical protein
VSRVAAHLILGRNEEPFLAALLLSLVGVADMLIVNDNAPEPSPHSAALDASWFAQHGYLIVDRAPFASFADARNICMERHTEHDAGDWVAFVDADETHGTTATNIAKQLDRVPAEIDFVDAYTWHFFQSFDWYDSIARRRMFFRFRPGVRWEGRVHERLIGLSGGRIVLPYVYADYGDVLPARRHAEKGRFYSSLGQPGETIPAQQLDTLDAAVYFRDFWPHLLRFHGDHPPAAAGAITQLRQQFGAQFARTGDLVRRNQPWLVRQWNALDALNYEQRWRSRFLNPHARAFVARP